MAKLTVSGGTPVPGSPWSTAVKTGQQISSMGVPVKTKPAARSNYVGDTTGKANRGAQYAPVAPRPGRNEKVGISSASSRPPARASAAELAMKGIDPKAQEPRDMSLTRGRIPTAEERAPFGMPVASERNIFQQNYSPGNPYDSAIMAATQSVTTRSMDMTGAEIANMLRGGGVNINTIPSAPSNSGVGQRSMNDPYASTIANLRIVDPADTIAERPPTMSQVLTGKEITAILSQANETDVTPPSQLGGEPMLAPGTAMAYGNAAPVGLSERKTDKQRENAEDSGITSQDVLNYTPSTAIEIKIRNKRIAASKAGPGSKEWNDWVNFYGTNPRTGEQLSSQSRGTPVDTASSNVDIMNDLGIYPPIDTKPPPSPYSKDEAPIVVNPPKKKRRNSSRK